MTKSKTTNRLEALGVIGIGTVLLLISWGGRALVIRLTGYDFILFNGIAILGFLFCLFGLIFVVTGGSIQDG